MRSLSATLLCLLSSQFYHINSRSVHVSSSCRPSLLERTTYSKLDLHDRLRHLKGLFAAPILHAYTGPTVPTAIHSQRSLSTMSSTDTCIVANGCSWDLAALRRRPFSLTACFSSLQASGVPRSVEVFCGGR